MVQLFWLIPYDMDINRSKKEGGVKDCSFTSAVMVSGLLGEDLLIT